jgi:heme-degrading monooxygenase HmoA
MAETWTFSEWFIGDSDPTAFISAFDRFAQGATDFGGAAEGMTLQDADDPSHFVVVRRWDGPDAVERWATAQSDFADELGRLVPEGGRGSRMTKVADLGSSAAH